MYEIAYGDRLTHLSTKGWIDGRRDWAVTTRWIRKEHAVPSIYLTIQMLRALWKVGRVRYGISEDSGTLELPSPDFTPDKLREIEGSSTRELSMSVFAEFKNPPSPTNAEPTTTEDVGEAAPEMSRTATLWKQTRASRILDRISSGLRWLGQWLLRFVLRTIRAFLAGVGAFALLVLSLARSVGIEHVNTEALLGMLVTGGVVGVVVQRSFKKFTLLRKMGESLTLRAAAIAGTE